MTDSEARAAIIAACRSLNTLGINQGTSGNISVRVDDAMLISPSATPYDTLRPEQIARMPLDGDGAWDGPLPPSTEWRIHRDVLLDRPEIGAVVHAHPTCCTALAMARRSIPPCHYMIAAFGGHDVRCAPYATFGTPELSIHAVEALRGRLACLLANHGMVACGPTLRKAMWVAVELEAVARQYCQSLALGGPVLLTDAEMDAALARFAGYGLANPA
ncbi:MAG TPA: class II aldolase/adducin family protein [Acetobacteraceae bacterium]|nr:class II aldolase/adducin family protein [Acetobacteraceae bacterium]